MGAPFIGMGLPIWRLIMDIKKIFKKVKDTEVMPIVLKELLDKIMTLKNPMDFDDEFATDEQLDALEDALDGQEGKMPMIIKFIDTLSSLKPTSGETPFI